MTMAEYNPHARDERENLLQKRGRVTEEFFASMDWDLLKKQYLWLCEQQEAAHALIPSEKQHWQSLTPCFMESEEMAEGLINFLDSFKDLAVDHFGLLPEQVYSLKEEEE